MTEEEKVKYPELTLVSLMEKHNLLSEEVWELKNMLGTIYRMSKHFVDKHKIFGEKQP